MSRYADVEPEVAALVKKAVETLAKLGAIVEEVDPGFENPSPIFRTFWVAGAAKLLRGFSPEQQAVIEEGRSACSSASLSLNFSRLSPS